MWKWTERRKREGRKSLSSFHWEKFTFYKEIRQISKSIAIGEEWMENQKYLYQEYSHLNNDTGWCTGGNKINRFFPECLPLHIEKPINLSDVLFSRFFFFSRWCSLKRTFDFFDAQISHRMWFIDTLNDLWRFCCIPTTIESGKNQKKRKRTEKFLEPVERTQLAFGSLRCQNKPSEIS